MNETKPGAEELTDVLPIEKQKIKGKIKHVLVIIPALDARWIVERRFGFYVFPPKKFKNNDYAPEMKHTWIMSMSYVLDDIWWLCELQYHKFWSQIIYDKNAMNGIKSFLHLAPLQKLYYRYEDQEILSMYKRIKKAVFQFVKRLTRSKESELHFMSDEKYREIMSENEIIPMSLLLCLCTVYGEKHQKSMEVIISHLVKTNQNLKLEKTVQRTIELFSTLKKKLEYAFKELKRNLRYVDDYNDILDAINSYRRCLFASVQFLTNAAVNISNFLLIFKDGCDIFSKSEFELHIVRTYKKLLVPMYSKITILFCDLCNQPTYHYLTKLLDVTRLNLIKAFSICLQTTLDKSCIDRMSHDIMQRYVKILKLSIGIQEFFQDFSSFYNMEEVIEKIKKNCPVNVDLSEINKMSDIVSQVLKTCNNECTGKEKHSSEKNEQTDEYCIVADDIYDYANEFYGSDENTSININELKLSVETSNDNDFSSDCSNWSDDENSDCEYECYLATSNEYEKSRTVNGQLHKIKNDEDSRKQNESSENDLKISKFISNNHISNSSLSEVELNSAIAHIKDLLPHLEEKFIALCLKYYKMDVSAVINSVLEDIVPEPLKSMDFIFSSNQSDNFQDIMDTYKRELYDQNQTEMEMNLRELKKPEYMSYNEMFNDKKEINSVKSIYEKYSNIEENDIYNDDVDEGYDDHRVSLLEVDPEGFDFMYEKETVSNMDPEEKDGPKIENTDYLKKNLDFCENPEIIRARDEHQRAVVERKGCHRNYRCYSNRERNVKKLGKNMNVKERYLEVEKPHWAEEPYADDKFCSEERHYNKEGCSKEKKHSHNKEERHTQEKYFRDQKFYNSEKKYEQEKYFDSRYAQNENVYKRERQHLCENERFQKEQHFKEHKLWKEQSCYEQEHGNVEKGSQGENCSRNRHHKSVYESRNAHHNRKLLSDRKRKF